MRFHLEILLCLVSLTLLRVQAAVLYTEESVRRALEDNRNLGQQFELVGTVGSYSSRPEGNWVYVLCTESGCLPVYELNKPIPPRTNPRTFGLLDRICVTGRLFRYKNKLLAGYSSAERLERGHPEQLTEIQPDDLNAPENLGKLFRLRGLVRDATRDDSDPNYIHLTLQSAHGSAQVMVNEPAHLASDHHFLLGTTVTVVGSCTDNICGLRHHIGRMMAVSGLENVHIERPASTFADTPDLELLATALPKDIETAGFHQATGRILAVWGRRIILLRTQTGRLVRVHLQGEAAPSTGSTVRVRGLPTTDYYNLNLIHALWEPAEDIAPALDSVCDVTPEDLISAVNGRSQLKMLRYGTTVRMSGTIRHLPDSTQPQARMILETGGQFVAVDPSSIPNALNGLELGCTISITGTCIMQADDWNRNSAETLQSTYFLVPRTADDIFVLSRPPWRTPGRLIALLSVCLATLLGVLFWNIALNRRARVKGRELAAEQMARESAQLKADERTRLAVELHDSMSQTLTGVSMAVDTSRDLVDTNTTAARHNLDLASKTIDACRLELRNTLWDLRSQALEEADFNTAIRKSLWQNLQDVDLSVRVNIPRERLTENIAHAIIKIIRELTTNAVRHGHATEIKVAGSLENNAVSFSVRDNGYGFDPETVPGLAEGHFGLQGIRERIKRCKGTLTIESEPGKGTRVVCKMRTDSPL